MGRKPSVTDADRENAVKAQEKLRSMLAEPDFTIKGLAEETGLTENQLYHISGPRRSPSVDAVNRFLAFVNMKGE